MLIKPDWPAPSTVKAAITTRLGGVSASPFDSLNLALHVGDKPSSVLENRRLLELALASEFGCSPELQWLEQIHSCDLVHLSQQLDATPQADAAYTQAPQLACCVMTADCLPLLVCDRFGREVAAVHAGWKGLANGIISKTLTSFNTPIEDLLVYLGPAISQKNFQVGRDVLEAFICAEQQRPYSESIRHAFVKDALDASRYRADLYRLALAELQGAGVQAIFGGQYCTYDAPDLFSYRQSAECGRMVSLIWLSSL
ncbi:peptidoglycan editing factor PgeF [Agaribacterium sp. ZY112]|uniref:peptidoglycan editing factor PgeF n=1 Tax=Agaribacterium sp. ZY112 TaxID=3233574 RepID=UPI00352639F9